MIQGMGAGKGSGRDNKSKKDLTDDEGKFKRGGQKKWKGGGQG